MAEKQENHIVETHDAEPHIVSIQQEAAEDARHIDLSWRSWLVVFITCFAYVLPAIYLLAWTMFNVGIGSWHRCLLS